MFFGKAFNRNRYLLVALTLCWSSLCCVRSLQAQVSHSFQTRFPEPKFEHLDLKDGLPDLTLRCMLQDRFGFLWIGTQNGLARYDGYSMVVYQWNPEDPNSLSDNIVNALCEDHAGALWVGTYSGGLNKFNRSDESFTRFPVTLPAQDSIRGRNVTCIYEDHENRLWVGFAGGGISLLDRASNSLVPYLQQDSLFSSEVYTRVSNLERTGRRIGSIVRVGNNANVARTFTLKRQTQVLVIVMGEDVLDYGSLENEDGLILLRSDIERTCWAGGALRNRVVLNLMTLPSGRYRIRYKSDEGHSYGNWVQEAPSHPEFWGIQVFDVSGGVGDMRALLSDQKVRTVRTNVHDIIEDKETGSLLVGTTDRPGLWTFEVGTGILSRHNRIIGDSLLSRGDVLRFLQAKTGNIWVASSLGLTLFDSRRDSCASYQLVPATREVPENQFKVMVEDPTGLLWLGHFETSGLECFDPYTKQFHRYTSESNNPFGLTPPSGSPFVTSLCYDRSGALWVGTWGGTLAKWARTRTRFPILTDDPSMGPKAFSFCEDETGGILIGAFYGVVQLKGSTTHPILPRYSIGGNTNHPKNRVLGIVRDPMIDGVIWIASRDSGLGRIDSKRGSCTYYRNDPLDTTSIDGHSAYSLLMDHEGTLWIGTEAGLNMFDRRSRQFRHFSPEVKLEDPLAKRIEALYEDRHGTIWVGSEFDGMGRVDRKTGKIVWHMSLVPGKEYSSILAFCEDHQGRFWVGGYVEGLHLLDRGSGKSIRHLTESDGLANNTVNSIVEDGSGYLWIGTRNGLSRLDPRTLTFRNFWVEDGLPGNFFGKGSLKCRDGRIVLGGGNWVTAFYPDSIRNDLIPPQVLITNVSLFNRPKESLTLNGYVPEMSDINLQYDQNDLRFEFVGLQFSEPARNHYKYFLENYDQAWVDAGTQRNATYTHLDPGEYKFRVTASNRDGIWNEQGASIRIMITPPWWETGWAYICYALGIFGVLYSIRRSELQRHRLKYQAEIEHTRAESLAEVDSMKSRFFANISHEFRTPLTLIMGPLEGMLAHEKEDGKRRDLGMMYRNARRLLQLINQLLDLSKLEAGAMKLRTSRENIVPLVRGITASFESSAGGRQIAATFEAEKDDIEVYFDQDKLEKILTNLLSNAFKFTPDGGSVSVTVRKSDASGKKDEDLREGFVSITVSDTGIGIPQSQLDKVFKRFYQADLSRSREREGSGIGLALTKELVELHHGTIAVQSRVGQGTEFTLKLPLGRNHLAREEIVEDVDSEMARGIDRLALSSKEEGVAISTVEERDTVSPGSTSGTDQRPIVLLVEDNVDVRAYMRECLVPNNDVQEACDGEDGISKAFGSVPDLIISDVMMPMKDGYELCRSLKSDERTSHIPIILLTAKAGTENKIEGLETGADDYLVKPFEARELLVRVKNLIDGRRKLRERFSVGQVLKPGDIAVTSLDDAFLQRAIALVEECMGDETFGVEQLRDGLGMSRTQLHRKLTALTNQSAGDFIRYMRLQRARDLLRQRAGTVSEIAFHVGFSSVAYFTKCFREQFGIVPSEIRKTQV